MVAFHRCHLCELGAAIEHVLPEASKTMAALKHKTPVNAVVVLEWRPSFSRVHVTLTWTGPSPGCRFKDLHSFWANSFSFGHPPSTPATDAHQHRELMKTNGFSTGRQTYFKHLSSASWIPEIPSGPSPASTSLRPPSQSHSYTAIINFSTFQHHLYKNHPADSYSHGDSPLTETSGRDSVIT